MSAVNFDKQEYWHARFESESEFEWLVSPATLLAVLEPYLPDDKAAPILHLGFGTSGLQNELRARGFENVVNVDYEPRAVQRGRAREEERFGDVRMEYVVADVTDFRTERRFTLVVDKGTVDAVACGGEEALVKMGCCVEQCLGKGGVWISVSYSERRFEVHTLPLECKVVRRFPTRKLKAMDPDIHYFCYALQRKTGVSL